MTDIDVAQPRASHLLAFADAPRRERVVVSMRRIVASASRRTTLLEALVHPPDRQAPPLSPAALVEAYGDVHGLDLYVINRAASELRRWRAAGWSELHLLVQCTPAVLGSATFADEVAEIVRAHDLTPDSLWIGVDHHHFADPDALTTLRLLTDHGIRLVPTGVGADLSTAPMWSVMRIAAIRIDEHLIAAAAVDEWWSSLVSAIVDTALLLDCAVLADGVESESDEATACELGIALLGGPRYGRSYDPDELLHPLLDESRPEDEYRIAHSPIPADEEDRLRALRACEVLDTDPEDVFDRITRAAAELCDAPIAVISLVDRSRQWFKSKVGLDVSETPRDMAFCAHAVMGHEPLIVDDALADPRFRRNPLVVLDPTIRFYAGIPLITSSGQPIGTLCVIDRRPRTITAEQLAELRNLAQQVVFHLEW